MNKYTLFLVFIFLLTACKTSQVSEPHFLYNTKIDTFKIETTRIEKEIVSMPIDDSIIIAINDAKDSICDEQINKILSQINFSKISGNNEYSILYNQSKRQLEIIAKMRQWKNSSSNITEKIQDIKHKIKEIPVKVPVYTNILTKWQKILIGLGISFTLFHIIRLIIKLKP